MVIAIRAITRWRLKDCFQCGGDMCLDKDQHGEEWQCLQCGRGTPPLPAIYVDLNGGVASESGGGVVSNR